MGLLSRIVGRVRDELEADEGLLASVLGREAGGRRRVAIVATDRRVLLTSLRPEPPVELAYGELEATCEVDGGTARITIEIAGSVHEIDRIGDIAGARLFVELLGQRIDAPTRPVPPQRVRLIG